MKKIRNIFSYISHNGLSWLLFRMKYEFRKKTGYFDRRNKRISQRTKNREYGDSAFAAGIINRSFKGQEEFVETANRARSGEIYCFSNQYLDYSHGSGKIDWHYNPVNGKNSPEDIAWNKLPDFGEYGDIKLIWEASRFPQVYAFINAYAVTRDAAYADACLGQIVDWCRNNPFPYGVNYKCGQEIAFRLIAWTVAADYFSDFIDDEFRKTVSENIYTSLLRISMNIDYAAKSVRNNHSISEAAGLFIGGMLFPELPDSGHFIKKGIGYLKTELAYQVYEDGSYIQHSMIYQRLVLDLLSLVMLIAEKAAFELPEIISLAHGKLLNFLYSFCQRGGNLPNYGSNDGTRLFPCLNSGYRDFRPSLNFACAVAHKKFLFEIGREISELFGVDAGEKHVLPEKVRFENGGYYILKNKDIFMMTRCHSYRHRPGQADMLHLDVWHKGENIFSDTGTYSYNPSEKLIGDFTATAFHNTVIIDNAGQMEKVLKFGFCNWTKSKLLEFTESSFTGEHYAYKKKYGITHRRKISCFDKHIVVEDVFAGVRKPVTVKQHWHTDCEVEQLDDRSFKVAGSVISSDCPASLETACISGCYNHYENGKRLVFENKSDRDFAIRTRIDFRE